MFLARRFDPSVNESSDEESTKSVNLKRKHSDSSLSDNIVKKKTHDIDDLDGFLKDSDADDSESEDETPGKKNKRDSKNINKKSMSTAADTDSNETGPESLSVEPMEEGLLEVDPKHQAILEKFRKSVKETAYFNKQVDVAKMDEEAEIHGVAEPLPAPEFDESEPKRKPIMQWMNEPTILPDESVPLPAEIAEPFRQRLTDMGVSKAFAIQGAVIPQILSDASSIAPDTLPDILVNSYTGSGKTLAYALPVVQILSTRVVPCLRALVVLPTKPLALQVYKVFEAIHSETNLNIMLLGNDMTFSRESRLLSNKVADIVISTPGRLVDHIRTGNLDIMHLKYLVIDEADQLLNQTFNEWISVLNQRIYSPFNPAEEWVRRPQKLVFSATLTRDPGRLALLKISPNHKVFVVSRDENEATKYEFSLPASLYETLVMTDSDFTKPLRLAKLLQLKSLFSHVLVFCKSNEAATRLARLLVIINEEAFAKHPKIASCTGEVPVGQRNRLIRAFTEGEIDILISTDLIARGIDISNVDHVINYDLPSSRRDYVHRVGRTARAGKKGHAWSLSSNGDENRLFWGIAMGIARSHEIEKIDWMNYSNETEEKRYEAALERLADEVKNTRG